MYLVNRIKEIWNRFFAREIPVPLQPEVRQEQPLVYQKEEVKVLGSLTSSDLKNSERELVKYFSETFKTIWVEYTKLGTICITAFPVDTKKNYRIFVERNVKNPNFEKFKAIIESKM